MLREMTMRTAILLLCTAFTSAVSAASVGGWAMVDGKGFLLRGQNAVSVNQSDNGIFIVEFTRPVKRCTFTATVGDDIDDGETTAGYVTVAAANEDPTGVYVTTFDADGTPSNRGFHLNVRC
jgi:hypothetical protein